MNNAVATLVAGDPVVSGWYNQNTAGVAGDPVVSGWYNQNTAGQGMGTVQNCYINQYPYWWQSEPTYHYYHVLGIQDKTKKAFTIAKELVKSKFMVARKIDEFIELVEMIESKL